MKYEDAIYQIECKDCEQIYRLDRPLKIRIASHRKEAVEVTRNKRFTRRHRVSSLRYNYKSAVAEYVATKNHSLNWADIKSLWLEPNWRHKGSRGSNI